MSPTFSPRPPMSCKGVRQLSGKGPTSFNSIPTRVARGDCRHPGGHGTGDGKLTRIGAQERLRVAHLGWCTSSRCESSQHLIYDCAAAVSPLGLLRPLISNLLALLGRCATKSEEHGGGGVRLPVPQYKNGTYGSFVVTSSRRRCPHDAHFHRNHAVTHPQLTGARPAQPKLQARSGVST